MFKRAVGMGGASLALSACIVNTAPVPASLERAAVTVSWPESAGLLDDAGRLKTDNGYRVSLGQNQVRVYVGKLTLEGPSRTALTLAPVNFVAFVGVGGRAVLDSFGCDPSCYLEQGSVSQVQLDVTRLEAYGQVEAGPGQPALGVAPVNWELSMPVESLKLPASVQATIAGSGEPRWDLEGALQLDTRLFDGLDWAGLAKAQPNGTVKLEADAKTRETLLAALTRSQWSAMLRPLVGRTP